jgi:hypothetical protein
MNRGDGVSEIVVVEGSGGSTVRIYRFGLLNFFFCLRFRNWNFNMFTIFVICSSYILLPSFYSWSHDYLQETYLQLNWFVCGILHQDGLILRSTLENVIQAQLWGF